MANATSVRPTWSLQRAMASHYARHWSQWPPPIGPAEYEASALDTVLEGMRLTYTDSTLGEARVGYYHRPTNRFTALSDDETRILTHLRPSDGEAQVSRLPDSSLQVTGSTPDAAPPDVDGRARSLKSRVAARVAADYELFFVTGEGIALPDGAEEASGYVVDENEQIYRFWLGWDTQAEQPDFVEWEAIRPERPWFRTREYRDARQKLRLRSPDWAAEWFRE